MATVARATGVIIQPLLPPPVLTPSTELQSSGPLQRAGLPVGAPVRALSSPFSSFFLHLLLFFYIKWWTDHRAAQKPFSSQRVKETLTAKVFKLSHKPVAFRQIEQNGSFQGLWSSMWGWGQRGPLLEKGLNGCIMLPVGVESRGPFHT